jgi:hypothetical protein
MLLNSVREFRQTGRKSHTRMVYRHETISATQGDGIGENGTRNSETWAQSSAGHGLLGLLCLKADV